MPLTKFTANTAIIAALADLPNATDGLTPAQFKAKFDENPTAFKVFVNSLIDQLESTTAGASGAHQIGSAAISGVTGATVYAQLADIFSQLQGVVAGDIPDGTITEAKLAFAIATQAELDLVSVKESINSVPSQIYAYRNLGGL